jgi:hypothetical protein
MDAKNKPTCCCGPSTAPHVTAERFAAELARAPWIDGVVSSPIGSIPRARTEWTRADRTGEVRVRLGFHRMSYAVPPGLYAVGNPTPESPVFVSANYKLSFDKLRRELTSLDGWILVLDTKGINVWCAAGKGTFGTTELVMRVHATRLSEVVSHRRLIVPQLGASGVAAHAAQRASGFRVIYGPVHAWDIPAFLQAGLEATPTMRRVRFSLADRLVLVPIEIIAWGRFALLLAVVLFFAGGFYHSGYAFAQAFGHGLRAALLVLLALIAGGVVAPALLPLLPGRPFAVKGAIVGVALVAIAILTRWVPLDGAPGRLEAAAWLMILPAITAFVAMNFTGATTFTSLSGVKREMRYAVPAEIAGATLGLGLWIASLIVA